MGLRPSGGLYPLNRIKCNYATEYSLCQCLYNIKNETKHTLYEKIETYKHNISKTNNNEQKENRKPFKKKNGLKTKISL